MELLGININYIKKLFMRLIHMDKIIHKLQYFNKKQGFDIREIVREEGLTIKNKGLILAGAGRFGELWAEKLQCEDMKILCFADKNKTGQTLCGKIIISYRDVKKIKDKIKIFITARGDTKKEIKKMLLKMGLGDQIVHNPYINSTIDLHSHIHNSYMEGNNLMLERAELINSYLGRCSYLSAGAKLVCTKVGRYSCIGPDVRIIIGQHPTTKIISVHPAFYSTKNTIGYSYVQKNKFVERKFVDRNYAVRIGNDVWIGMGARIMEGVSIADGSIIAAGAVVVKDTKPYEIVGGIPAHHINYRFEKDEIKKLLELKWWNRDLDWIQKHAEEFEDVKNIMKY